MPPSIATLFVALYAVLLLWSSLLFWNARLVRREVRVFVRVVLGLLSYFTALKLVFLTPVLPLVSHLIGTGAWFWYVIGPLFYMVLRVLLDQHVTLRSIDGLHLFPLVGMLPGVLPFFVLSGEQKLELFRLTQNSAALPSLQSLFFGLVFFGYLGFAWRAVQCSVLLGHLVWRQRVLYSALVLMGGVILGDALASYSGIAGILKYHITIVLTLTAFCAAVHAALGFQRQPEDCVETPVTEVSPHMIKYRHTAVNKAELQRLGERLNQLMRDEKLYRSTQLQRRDLAERLGISVHRLSEILSQELETSFYAYVNRFRIEDAKRLLRDPSQTHLTLYAISLDVGFNSKSTFNRTFKAQTGVTPSAFRKFHRMESAIQARSS